MDDWTAGSTTEEAAPVWLEEVAPEFFSLARVLGVRTAELHHALSRAEGEDLRPVDAPSDAGENLARRLRSELEETRELLEQHDDPSPPQTLSEDDWNEAYTRIRRLEDLNGAHQLIRIHGDYHLGQLLRAEGDFYILDFEGEPARPLEERRLRENALRDVAGILRSLEYAVLAAWQEHAETDPDYAPWIDALLRWSEATFLNAYADTAEDAAYLPPTPARYSFLWAYLFQKAIYEVRYELNHRPDWAWLPLRGLRRLLGHETESAAPLSE